MMDYVVHLFPISKPATTGTHKSSYVAAAPLVKRVRHVLQVLEVVDAVPGGLLPGGLPADHEVAVSPTMMADMKTTSSGQSASS